MGVEQWQHQILIAEDDEARIGPPLECQGCAGDDDGWAMVATHGINRDCDRSLSKWPFWQGFCH